MTGPGQTTTAQTGADGFPVSPARARFSAYAVTSRSGPHVTMQAGVSHAGRFWTTTSCSSLKARSVNTHGVSSAVIDEGARRTVVSGRTTALRPFRPDDVLADPTAPLRAAGAVLRLGVDQITQLVGYLEAAGQIPADWFPHRRVLLVTRLDRSMTLDGFDVVETDGDWAGTDDELVPTGSTHRDLPHDLLPARHRNVVNLDGRVHVGVSSPDGPIALPARWLGQNRFHVSAPALARVGAVLPGDAVAVFDASERRRPDEKLGAMFRGRGSLVAVDGTRAIVTVDTAKVTTWDGFEADTVPV